MLWHARLNIQIVNLLLHARLKQRASGPETKPAANDTCLNYSKSVWSFSDKPAYRNATWLSQTYERTNQRMEILYRENRQASQVSITMVASRLKE